MGGRILERVTGMVESAHPEKLFAELDWRLHLMLSLAVFFGVPTVLLHPMAALFDAYCTEVVAALTGFRLALGSCRFAVAAGIIASLAKSGVLHLPIGSLLLSSFPPNAV